MFHVWRRVGHVALGWLAAAALGGCGVSATDYATAFADSSRAARALFDKGGRPENAAAGWLLHRIHQQKGPQVRTAVLALAGCPRVRRIALAALEDAGEPAASMASILRAKGRFAHNAVGDALHSKDDRIRAVAATALAPYLDVARLEALTKDAHPVVRGAAWAALCTEPPASWTWLRAATADPVISVRVAAAACARFTAPDALWRIDDALDAAPDAVARTVIRAVHSGCGKPARPWLYRWGTRNTSVAAVTALAQLAQDGDQEAIQRLAALVATAPPAVAAEAAGQLGHIDPPALMRLRSAVESADPQVRLAAARALLSPGAAVPWVDEMLRALWRPRPDPDDPVAHQALFVSARRGDETALAALRTGLAPAHVNAELPWLQEAASIDALRSAVAALLFHDDPLVRDQAAVALLRTCTP